MYYTDFRLSSSGGGGGGKSSIDHRFKFLEMSINSPPEVIVRKFSFKLGVVVEDVGVAGAVASFIRLSIKATLIKADLCISKASPRRRRRR